jgi:hypothetical protein
MGTFFIQTQPIVRFQVIREIVMECIVSAGIIAFLIILILSLLRRIVLGNTLDLFVMGSTQDLLVQGSTIEANVLARRIKGDGEGFTDYCLKCAYVVNGITYFREVSVEENVYHYAPPGSTTHVVYWQLKPKFVRHISRVYKDWQWRVFRNPAQE